MKKQYKKHQNAESIGEKLKTKGLMFFVSCDLQDFKSIWCKLLVLTELTLLMNEPALTVKKLELDFYNCSF